VADPLPLFGVIRPAVGGYIRVDRPMSAKADLRTYQIPLAMSRTLQNRTNAAWSALLHNALPKFAAITDVIAAGTGHL
jgi:hypothetical protein